MQYKCIAIYCVLSERALLPPSLIVCAKRKDIQKGMIQNESYIAVSQRSAPRPACNLKFFPSPPWRAMAAWGRSGVGRGDGRQAAADAQNRQPNVGTSAHS